MELHKALTTFLIYAEVPHKACRLGLQYLINQGYTYLIVNIFTVNLGLDDIHERIDQSCALPQLPPCLTTLRTHISLDGLKDEKRKNEKVNRWR